MSRSHPLLLTLTVLLALVLAGCQSFGGGAGATSSSRLDRILDSRELRVGLSANQPPLNMKSKSGEVIGLEVDMVDALARSMGLEVRE